MNGDQSMSAVRMCDRCGSVFPEGIEGSAVGTGTIMRRDDAGRRVSEQVPQDMCPPCAGGAVVPVFPAAPTKVQPALEG